MASKAIGRNQRQLSSLYSVALERKATQIFSDPNHPLNTAFEMLLSWRRIKAPLAKKNIYQKKTKTTTTTFVPSATVVLNGSFK